VYDDRRPPWLAELVDQRLREEFVGDPVFVTGQGGLEAWPMARRLVRLGAIARPAIAQYAAARPGCRLARSRPVPRYARAAA
jgi:hypothetical protein